MEITNDQKNQLIDITYNVVESIGQLIYSEDKTDEELVELHVKSLKYVIEKLQLELGDR